MKTILYCASTTGHLRSFHLPYLRALLDDGYRVTTAAFGPAEDLPEGVSHLDVPFTKRFFSPRNLGAALRMARELRRARYDLILTHTSLAAFFVRLAVLLTGKRDTRVVNTVHGYLFGESVSGLREKLLLAAERLTAPVTDDILVMNAEDERIARRYRLCRGQVARIPGMGVPPADLHPPTEQERAEARAALSIRSDAFVMVYAAEFSVRKNQRFLIENLSSLPEDTVLLLPGQGDKLEECRALAKQLGLYERVLFPGYEDDPRVCLWAADVCVSSSHSEGLPFHVMEAMAGGIPCLLSRVKGHTDLAESGAGLLFDDGDADAFRREVLRLASDPALRRRLGRAAQEGFPAFRLDRVLPEVLPLFRP